MVSQDLRAAGADAAVSSKGFVICLSRAEARISQIHACCLESVENLPGLLVADVARQQPVYNFRQRALHGDGVLQGHGFKPSLARSLCIFSRAVCLGAVMGIAVSRAPHGWGAAASAIVHQVLA
jgi:hypothetical protein